MKATQTIDCLFLVGKGPDGFNLAPSSEGLGLLLPQLNRHCFASLHAVIKKLAPDTHSLMEFKSQREVDLVTNIYSKFPPLGAFVPDSWNVSFTQILHMTNGSHNFRDGERLKDFGAKNSVGVHGGRHQRNGIKTRLMNGVKNTKNRLSLRSASSIMAQFLSQKNWTKMRPDTHIVATC